MNAGTSILDALHQSGRLATAMTELPNGSHPAIAFSARNHVSERGIHRSGGTCGTDAAEGRSASAMRTRSLGSDERLEEIPRLDRLESGVRTRSRISAAVYRLTW